MCIIVTSHFSGVLCCVLHVIAMESETTEGCRLLAYENRSSATDTAVSCSFPVSAMGRRPNATILGWTGWYFLAC